MGHQVKLTEKEIYLLAAERIASNREGHSCLAIDSVGGLPGCLYVARYREAMGFSRFSPGKDCFLAAILSAYPVDYNKRKNLRVLLLCMMAAACEDL